MASEAHYIVLIESSFFALTNNDVYQFLEASKIFFQQSSCVRSVVTVDLCSYLYEPYSTRATNQYRIKYALQARRRRSGLIVQFILLEGLGQGPNSQFRVSIIGTPPKSLIVFPPAVSGGFLARHEEIPIWWQSMLVTNRRVVGRRVYSTYLSHHLSTVYHQCHQYFLIANSILEHVFSLFSCELL